MVYDFDSMTDSDFIGQARERERERAREGPATVKLAEGTSISAILAASFMCFLWGYSEGQQADLSKSSVRPCHTGVIRIGQHGHNYVSSLFGCGVSNTGQD